MFILTQTKRKFLVEEGNMFTNINKKISFAPCRLNTGLQNAGKYTLLGKLCPLGEHIDVLVIKKVCKKKV